MVKRTSSPDVRSRLVSALTLCLMVLGALGLASVIARVQHTSDQRRQGQVLLARLDKKTSQMNALVWELAAQPDTTGNSGAQVSSLDDDSDQLLGQLLASDPDAPCLEPVRRGLLQYQTARDDEMRLLQSGRLLDARRSNGQDVVPAFDALADAIGDANRDFDRKATLAATETDIGTTGVLVGAALLLFALFRRFEHAQRRGVSLAAEREALRRSEQRFQALIRNASDVILIVTPSGEVRYASSVAERLWGRAPEELLGSSLFDIVCPDERARAQALVAQVKEGTGGLSAELRLCYADGSWRPSEVLLTSLLSEPGIEGLVLTCRDISERRAFEERLTHQAFHDALTGLPNRALLMERLRHALARVQRHAGPVGVVFLDLDNFKVINDSLGHEAGDHLLAAVAGRLGGCVRVGDTVARLGGDEFTLLLEDLADPAEVAEVAERVAEALRAPVLLAGREVFTAASLGSAVSGDAGTTPEGLLRDAALAMYQAKTGGKARCVVFDAAMGDGVMERLEMESDLRAALQSEEFRVYYQPIISLTTGRLMEVEALVRWDHPRHGLIPPSKFIPLAEETGLIVPLGRWVLREACRQARAWHLENRGGPAVTVSVNLSARQLQQPDLVEQVVECLRDTGLGADRLKLEITESMMMLNAEAAVGKLQRLKDLGVRLAVDDFGTGYSTMSYLSTLPLDTLKIDQSFVGKLGGQEEDSAIVCAIVTLAKTLNLRITSEGIETREQMLQLRALGSDLGQGYHFSRPLPARDITPLLSDIWSVAARPDPADGNSVPNGLRRVA